MKKYLILFTCLLLLAACSSDDSGNNESNIPADEKLLETLNVAGDIGFQFMYNEDSTVERVTINLSSTASYIFIFDYEDGEVSHIQAILGGESADCNFTHNANGKITGCTIGDIKYAAQYNAVQNSYLFSEQGENTEIAISLNENGDMVKYDMNDEYGDGDAVFVYFDDESKSGPMANTNNIQLYMSLIVPSLNSLLSLIGKKPVEIISTPTGNINCLPDYYNDGFIKSIDLAITSEENSDQMICEYKYTSLSKEQ